MQAGIVQGGDLCVAHALHACPCIGNGRRALAHLPGHLQPVTRSDEIACLGSLLGTCQQAAFHGRKSLPRAWVVGVQPGRIAKIHQRAIAVFAQPPTAQIFFAGTVEAEHALRGFHRTLQRAHLGILRRQRQGHDGQLTRLLERIVLALGLFDQVLAALDQPAPRLLQPATAGRILAVGTLLDRQIQRDRIVGTAKQPIFLQGLVGTLARLRQRFVAQVHCRRLPLRHGLGGFFATDRDIRLARHRSCGCRLWRSGRCWRGCTRTGAQA